MCLIYTLCVCASVFLFCNDRTCAQSLRETGSSSAATSPSAYVLICPVCVPLWSIYQPPASPFFLAWSPPCINNDGRCYLATLSVFAPRFLVLVTLPLLSSDILLGRVHLISACLGFDHPADMTRTNDIFVLLLLTGPARQIPDPQSQQPRIQSFLFEDEG